MKKLTMTLDYEAKVGTLRVDGETSVDYYIKYINTCRKQYQPDWIQIIDIRNSQTYFDVVQMDKIANETKQVSLDFPIVATILITSGLVTKGLVAMYQEFSKRAKVSHSIFEVHSPEEAEAKIKEIRTRKYLNK